jgi:hypothetical protein
MIQPQKTLNDTDSRETDFIGQLDAFTNLGVIGAFFALIVCLLWVGEWMRDNNAQLRDRVEAITGEAAP